MNKFSQKLIIYDDVANKSNLDNEDVILWNSYIKNERSILNQIEKESVDIKKEVIKELEFFHIEHQKYLQKINIKIQEKVNFWSINSMFDNNIYDQFSINNYIKFFQLKKIIKKKSIGQIILHSNDKELIFLFSNFSRLNKITLNIKLTKKKFIFKKESIKKLIHPIFLAFPIFLIFLFKRIKYFLKPIRKSKNITENLFVNYFFGSDSSKGSFQSVYWGNLDEVLEKNNIKRTWLHLSVPQNTSGKSKKLLDQLNTNPLSEHLMLDNYLSFKIFFKIILIWFKVVLNLKKINKSLNNNLKNNFLYFLFQDDFKENIFGYKFLVNLYYFYLFELFLKERKYFKKCFYLYENQSWERSLIYNLNDKTNKFGVTRASLRFWDFRYFKMDNLYKNPEFSNFSHDKILTGSDKFKEILLNNNNSDDKIILVEALRHENISSLKDKIAIKNNKSCLVVMGDYTKDINQKIELCIKLLNKNNEYSIICKPHPLNDFNKKLYASNFVYKSNDTVKELADKYDNFIVSNTSTVGLELYLMGKNVITILDDVLINFSPLKHYFKYTNYVYDINEINQKIKDSIKYAPQSNFFKYEQNLETWIKILKND